MLPITYKINNEVSQEGNYLGYDKMVLINITNTGDKKKKNGYVDSGITYHFICDDSYFHEESGWEIQDLLETYYTMNVKSIEETDLKEDIRNLTEQVNILTKVIITVLNKE